MKSVPGFTPRPEGWEKGFPLYSHDHDGSRHSLLAEAQLPGSGSQILET